MDPIANDILDANEDTVAMIPPLTDVPWQLSAFSTHPCLSCTSSGSIPAVVLALRRGLHSTCVGRSVQAD